jgi:PAS domain S-box-containing protein
VAERFFSYLAQPAGFVPDNFMARPALLRELLEMIDDAVIVTSPDLAAPGPYIEYVNTAFERMTGYSAEEVIGRSPRFLQGRKTDRMELDRMGRELECNGHFDAEIVNYRKDETPFVIRWRVKALHDEAGKVAGWLSVQRDITAERDAVDKQRQLAREVDHRAGNALALVQGIVRLTCSEEPKRYAEAVQGRVDALATAHALLSEMSWRAVTLKRLVDAELARSSPAGKAIIAGSDVELPPDLVQPVALLLHEMVSNAVKHGSLSASAGQLLVEWGVVNSELVLGWKERDGPSPPAERSQGFGLPMVEAITARQLGGKVMLNWRAEGLSAELRVPLRKSRSRDKASSRLL